MSGATKRRASRMDADDEADASISSSDTSDGSKRMRLRGGRGAPRDLEMEDEDEDAQDADDDVLSLAEDGGDPSPPRPNGRVSTSAASATEFSPGAIVRVALENFVTYSKAEFFPGPNLNMVIGPNGTGKSSLVCAICLGLGYQPSVLGRADKVGQYVKHGNSHAIVEVELQKRPRDRANYVIKLRIQAEDNNRQFWVNGKETTLKAIKNVMRHLRIQIDNLCQFLPQDKVAEFSAMEPIELLNKTLLAAASEEVIAQQEQLKQLFNQQKALRRNLETETETLRGLESRQQGLQADVERLREREQIQKVVDDLTDARKIVFYNDQRRLHNEVKEKKKKAEKRRRRLERDNQPALEDVDAKTSYCHAVEQVVMARRLHAQAVEADADKDLQAVEKAKEEMGRLENEKILERETMGKKRKEVGQCRAKITQIEGQMESLKDIETKFNAKEWNHKIRECENQSRELKAQKDELESSCKEIIGRGRTKTIAVKAIRQEIHNLDSQEGQKLAQLRSQAPDAAKAYEWLQGHRDEFDKEVFGPAYLTCSIKDKRYSDLVQSGLQRDDLFCFTAQTKSDHRKLTDVFYNQMNAAVSIRTILSDLATFRPPVPKQDLTAMGLDGFAMDFIEGPDPVLAMLCSEKKIHLTGVALKDFTEEQYQRLYDGEKISSFAAGKTYYRITRRREYGPGATSTITKKILPGRWWTDEPMDMSAKAELEERFSEGKREMDELKAQVAGLNGQVQELEAQIENVQEKQSKLEEEKATLQRDFSRYRRLPDEIEKQKKNLQRARDDLEAARGRILDHDEQIDQVALKQAKLILHHNRRLRLLQDANQAVLEAHTRHIEAISDLDALRDRSAGIVQMLEAESEKVEELEREAKRVKHKAQEAQIAALERLGDDDEKRTSLSTLAAGKTMESITEDIDAEQAKLELIHDADPGLLRDFEDRARRIDRARAEMATKQASLEQLEASIQEVKEIWEPALDDIIRRINDAFSYNFEQINCAGEVGVHKDEDFDKWSIEIKVKFRENETLQLFDKHRQSGGERSVSTIFYLMSLQAMAQAPFRVVDEINQGMDPRNERMVHERMVDIACHEHTSQYFLITPKLLGGLRYDERMKILCIASGEHMPSEGSKLDFSKVVKIKKRLMAAAGA